jgi:hypothetical protein
MVLGRTLDCLTRGRVCGTQSTQLKGNHDTAGFMRAGYPKNFLVSVASVYKWDLAEL